MSGVIDRDLGYHTALKALRRLKRIAVRVGITDPTVAEYAAVHEGDKGFLRDTFDAREAKTTADMADVVDAAIDGASTIEAAKAAGENLKKAVRGAIEDRGLVDTGALRDSVTVEVDE